MSLPEENTVIIDGQTYYGGLNQPNLKFVKVNVDCWERIFDFLELYEILAMGHTCQRMRQIAGHYFRENFHGTTCMNVRKWIYISTCPIDGDHFLRFIDTLQLHSYTLEYFRDVSISRSLNSLTTLQFFDMALKEDDMHGLENVQANIENIELIQGYVDDNHFGEFLASCPKLKKLRLECVDFRSPAAMHDLIHRTLPTLEHLDFITSPDREKFLGGGTRIVPIKMPSVTQMVSFLERNASIKCLHVKACDLGQISLDTTAQVDCLTVNMKYLQFDANEVADQLKSLYSAGFFKKLHLIAHDMPYTRYVAPPESFFQELSSLHALEILEVNSFYTSAMTQLIELKELRMWVPNKDIDLEILAMNLVKLERLWIRGTVEHLLCFLRHSKKLKFVIFSDFTRCDKPLNVFNLNRVRKTSGMEQKVQIGLTELLYLPTKWAQKNGSNYDSVEINRAEKIQGKFHAYRFDYQLEIDFYHDQMRVDR